MATDSTIPQPVIRLLVESRQLAWSDLLKVALTNKTHFRVVSKERQRYRIRWLPIAKQPMNPLWSALEARYAQGLEEKLALAEFDKDATSTNGRLMHEDGGRGVYRLIGMCIRKYSADCLGVVLKWINESKSFSYDPAWVYAWAAHMALSRNRLECLIHLHDRDENEAVYGSPTEIYRSLLKNARSPAAIHWLARRMPKGTDYLPILIAQLSKQYATPALIDELINFVPRYRLSSAVPQSDVEDDYPRGPRPPYTPPPVTATAAAAATPTPTTNITPISSTTNPPSITTTTSPTISPSPTLTTAITQASSTPHLPALHLLLRSSALTFYACLLANNPSICNPLAAALSASSGTPLSRGPPAPYPCMPMPVPPPKMQAERVKAGWEGEVSRCVGGMRAVVGLLLEEVKNELPSKGRKGKKGLTANDVRDFAAVTYMWQLRAYLLGNLGWMLDDEEDEGKRELRGKLLVEVEDADPLTADNNKKKETTAWEASYPAAAAAAAVAERERRDECREEHGKVQTFVWRAGLGGRWVRARLHEAGLQMELLESVWEMVATPTTAQFAAQFLDVDATSTRTTTVDVLWNLLLADEKVVSTSGEMPRTEETKVEEDAAASTDEVAENTLESATSAETQLHSEASSSDSDSERVPTPTSSESDNDHVLSPTPSDGDSHDIPRCGMLASVSLEIDGEDVVYRVEPSWLENHSNRPASRIPESPLDKSWTLMSMDITDDYFN